MARQRVLIIGGRIQNLQKATGCGLGVVYLQQPDQFTGAHARLVDAALLVDYTDWSVVEPLVLAAHRAYGFGSVATTTEAGLEPAGRINDLLGLPGVGHRVARLLRDKLAMREHLRAVGADTVAAGPVTDPDSLARFGAEHGYPFIVKPVDGIGSLGLTLVDGPDRLDGVWRRLERLAATAHQYQRYFPIDRFLMEEYIDGPEYSVEAFTFDGRHVVVSVTEKLTDTGFIELGHAVPARLEPPAEQAIVDTVTAFLDAVGIVAGPSHTEVRLSAAGPRVIESHNRPGGDRIRDLIEQACGFDIEAYTVAWPSGVLPALTGRPRPVRAAATRFLSAPPGLVREISGVAEARRLPGVLDVAIDVAVGGRVEPLRSSWDRVGQVVAVGADTTAALAACAGAADAVRVVTDPAGTADGPAGTVDGPADPVAGGHGTGPDPVDAGGRPPGGDRAGEVAEGTGEPGGVVVGAGGRAGG